MREGRELWNFASNDYLGLAQHPEVVSALMEGVRSFGAGAAASRLICGTFSPHRLLEDALAEAKQTEAALTFSSGFATAMGVIPAVVGKSDFIFLDKLSHACLVDAARLSGSTIRVFPHNDVARLKKLLISTRAKFAHSRILVVTESVFSMDGDTCPLRAIIELTESHQALLLLDEAHGFGVLGKHGMGLAEQENLQQRITFQMGTLSKSAGLAGGYLAASRAWIDYFINCARSFIYSTAPPPALAHAAIHSLALIRSDEGRRLRAKLQESIARFSSQGTPIVPIMLGSSQAVISAASFLEERGLMVGAIRYPTVARGAGRLRISLSANHTLEATNQLASALASLPTQ
jgi:8-amino-7-oxononanoate synthase